MIAAPCILLQFEEFEVSFTVENALFLQELGEFFLNDGVISSISESELNSVHYWKLHYFHV